MLLDKRQLSLALLLIGLIAAYFWSQSRYPALDTKAQMGQRASISAIAFDVMMPVDVGMPYLERVYRSSVNWGYTNWKGMTFGFLFSAAFITLLSLLPNLPASRFRTLNAIKGMVLGIPLGVCANCSTPIAYGMMKAGTRIETALGTQISSPTLNVIVLTMTFSLLPFEMAVIKLVGVLVFVVVIIPLLVRWLLPPLDTTNATATALEQLNPRSADAAPPACTPPATSWWQAISQFVTRYLSNLVFIVRLTLPLMLLAGILGAFVIESLAPDALTVLETSFLTLVLVSLIGAFLPVPMTFDVIAVMSLLAAGFAPGLAMALLFSLGIFSIYPTMMIARRVSLKLALGLFFSVVIMAALAGWVLNQIDQAKWQAVSRDVQTLLDTAQPDTSATVRTAAQAGQTAASSNAGWQPLASAEQGIVMHALRLSDPAPLPGINTVFQSVPAADRGLHLPFDFRLSDFYEPFKYGRGIASGDINNDHFPDLVIATSSGPAVFLNRGDGHFARQPLPLSNLTPAALNTFLVAFVDLNNDGWQDLFFTTYGGQNYWLENQLGGGFAATPHALPNTTTSLTMAAGFVDLNHTGYADIFLGNWTAGAENQFATRYSRNAWLRNQGGRDNSQRFTLHEDDQVAGETLSVLLSDINQDGHPDLIVANDNQEPDLYLLGQAGGGFARITPDQGIIPATSLTTMSVDSADFNNDLHLDIFTTDMSFGPGETDDYCGIISVAEHRQSCYQQLEGWQAMKDLKATWCNQQPTATRRSCALAFVTALAKTSRDPALCERIPAEQADIRLLCQRMAERIAPVTVSLADHIPQRHRNTLLLGSADGKFSDASARMNIDKSYWSWNSKAADLDNDGWQDILVSNGFGFGEQQNEIHSNVLFHNQQGNTFTRATQTFGLHELLNTPAYTLVDIDLDGDLDIIATAIMAPPRVYLNHTPHRSVSFALRDERGNRFCLGCRVIIRSADGQQQLREVKLSGGFLSFDEPVVQFGLHQQQSIQSVRVIWRDGSETLLEQPFDSGYRYRITRTASAN